MDKEEAKLSLCLINQAPRHDDVPGSGGIAPSFLTSALDGDEWAASRPGRFIRGENPRHPLYRRLGGTKSQYGRCGVKKNLLFLSGIEPSPSRP
jgi:hypothetical protein